MIPLIVVLYCSECEEEDDSVNSVFTFGVYFGLFNNSVSMEMVSKEGSKSQMLHAGKRGIRESVCLEVQTKLDIYDFTTLMFFCS